jgi:D-alanyl-D-alanine dipeptidase
MRCFALLGLLLMTLPVSAQILEKLPLALPKDCRQVVLVVAPEWASSTGSLQRLERSNDHAPWEPVGTRVPVLLGKRGLGWAFGERKSGTGIPEKAEGDLRSPAGAFALGPVFGRAPRADLPWLRMPYEALTATTEAIDDPKSRYYGQIVDRSSVAQPDWQTSEHMGRIAAYELGIVVGYNPEHRPGAGSCIFLHLWMEGWKGTSGCTALHRKDLEELVRWLEISRRPLLVQLPETLGWEN